MKTRNPSIVRPLNMRIVITIVTLMGAILLFGCKGDGKPKELSILDIEMKNGLVYERGSRKPYSGLIVEYFNDVLIELYTVEDGLENGPSKKYYKNGVLQYEVNVKLGKPDGLLRTWFESGQLATEVNFINGIAQGVVKEWYENGQIKSENILVNNIPDGKGILWYENGEKMSENEFREGLLDGKALAWREDGTPQSEGRYKRGVKEGTWVSWDANGEIITEREFAKGRLLDEHLLLPNEILDSDGNVYETITVGDQVWMRENLRTTHYQNGDRILNLSSNESWASSSDGAFSYYKNNPTNGQIYGALYNWFAVDDHRRIAPRGWHIPSEREWQQLITNIRETSANNSNLEKIDSEIAAKLAGRKELWKDGALKKSVSFGLSRFGILPAGYRQSDSGNFPYIGEAAFFWSSTESSTRQELALHFSLYDGGSGFSSSENYKRAGYSIRCVKN